MMKLSDGEKLIAMMLADLLEAGGVDGEADPKFVREAITSGHLWSLNWKYPAIFHGEEDSPEEVQETADILTMCRIVEGSIAELSDAERDTIPENDRQVFYGFDGNNEPHYGIAVMFIENMGRWEEFEGRNLNSHMPTLNRYHRMKAVYDAAGGAGAHPLPLDTIQAILAA
jgi:uncharacterized protein YfbU (UPF0304 family)